MVLSIKEANRKLKELDKKAKSQRLKPYISLIRNLGQKFHKNIDELIIDGDRDILVKEKASRGTFNVFATDKEKEAEQSIEKLNKEFDKLSDQFNARILPQIKEYGVDLKEIEQRKIAEKENQNKIEQEKIQKDLEEKLRSFGGM